MPETIFVDQPPRAPQESGTPDDLELIAEVNHGDHSAFEILYYRYRDWVLGLASRFTSDPHIALDVMQETFLYFLRKFPGFRLSVNLKSFLYPAVRHLSIAARKKSQRFQATESELFAIDRTAAPPDQTTGSLQDLNTVIRRLPEEQRETLLLRFVDGLSLAEISQAMDAPLGTVKSRLHNALKTLREDERTKEFLDR